MISGARVVLTPDVGAGCKNVDVSAFPVFRGVKCCCRVEKAGLVVFAGSSVGVSLRAGSDTSGSSGLETKSGVGALVAVSDLGLTMAVRVNPASLADALGAAGGGIEELPFDFRLLEPTRDLGLAVELSALLASLRKFEVLLVDCVRL
jgi:hypothetical protein